jgi:enoyl-CoA hydratase/carnithine racemase
MTQTLVLTRIDGPVGRLTLNDPAHANALSSEMMAAIREELARLNASPDVRVIVLDAAGKIFCPGHDLAELRSTEDAAAHEAVFAACSRLMLDVVESGKPVIAKVQGAAVAAGCQLVASCDLAYAADTAKFAVSGINLGLFCSTPGVALARSVNPKDALELLMTGRFVDANEAAQMGLINRVAPAEALEALVQSVAETIAGKAPEAIALGKRVFRQQSAQPLGEAYELASRAMAENLALPEARSGIDRFLKR